MNKLSEYERKLTAMVCKRRNVSEVEPWLVAQIHAAAMNWQMLDKVHDDLMTEELTFKEEGYNSQIKRVAHPLIPMYKDLQRSMLLHYKALGLNFDSAPKRMTETAAKGGHDDSDPLLSFME